MAGPSHYPAFVADWGIGSDAVKKVFARKLDAETLAEIQRCYLEILQDSGFGVIKVRIEHAGQKNESHFVVLEKERKTR